MRRRLPLLLIPLLAGLFLLRPHLQEKRALHIHFGEHAASVREVDLHFERELSVVRDLTLHFPQGAPADVDREVRLAAGEYQVGVRMVLAGGDERHVSRDLQAKGGEPADLDLDVR